MSEHHHDTGLTCSSDGYIYRITADDRYVYFHKMFREGKIMEQKDLGRLRLVKAEIEGVECKRERGKTVILIHHSGLTSRLGVKGEVREDLLFELFEGLPLKLSLRRHYANSPAQQELKLLSVCFVLALLRVLCEVMPEISLLAPYISLGWIVLPFVWMVFCARQIAPDGVKNRFPFAAGMFATLFSCAFLWLNHKGHFASVPQLILPSVILTAGVTAIYAMLRKKIVRNELLAVAIFVLLIYAPATAVNINQTLPALKTVVHPAVATEIGSNEDFTGWHYYAMFDIEGEIRKFAVSQMKAETLSVGENAMYIEKKGLLGIDYSYIDW